MDEITRAYIKVHGECPSARYSQAGLDWHLSRAMFRSGWACHEGWLEEQKLESASQLYTEFMAQYHMPDRGNPDFRDWLAKKIEQEELLEIEKDVLNQQEGAREGR